MDLQTLVAQWSGKLPDGFVPPAIMRRDPPQCVQHRCRKPASLKANGEYAKSCESCRIRRAKSYKRRPRRPGRRRWLPQMRVSPAAAGRLPLPAVPRRPRRRARAEAPGRHRRGRHRRVRGQARQGAPREQPRHGRFDLERPPAARTFRSCSASIRMRSRVLILIVAGHEAYWAPLPDPVPKQEREWERSIYDDGRRFHRY